MTKKLTDGGGVGEEGPGLGGRGPYGHLGRRPCEAVHVPADNTVK